MIKTRLPSLVLKHTPVLEEVTSSEVSRSVQDPAIQTGLGTAFACPGGVSVCWYVWGLNRGPRPQAIILLGTTA